MWLLIHLRANTLLLITVKCRTHLEGSNAGAGRAVSFKGASSGTSGTSKVGGVGCWPLAATTAADHRGSFGVKRTLGFDRAVAGNDPNRT